MRPGLIGLHSRLIWFPFWADRASILGASGSILGVSDRQALRLDVELVPVRPLFEDGGRLALVDEPGDVVDKREELPAWARPKHPLVLAGVGSRVLLHELLKRHLSNVWGGG